jgi:hypothetical protein
MLVNTVAENKQAYTNWAYVTSTLARKTPHIIGRPSTRDFISIVDESVLPNIPIDRHDIPVAEKIFGRDVGSLKGKNVHQGADHVYGLLVDIPALLITQYRDVTLAADIMFVNQIPFFVTISRNIKFSTVGMIVNQNAATLLSAVKQIQYVYIGRDFRIDCVLMDGQFDTLRADLTDFQITLNTTARDEHVPEVEHHIWTLKERVRSVYNTLPFKRLPARIIIKLVCFCSFWLDCFPDNYSISSTLRAVVYRGELPFNFPTHCAKSNSVATCKRMKNMTTH